MRVLTIRLCAASLLALALVPLHAGNAAACIKFDRAAEMAMIDKAIASRKTPDRVKATLRELKQEISAIQAKATVTGQDIVQNGNLTTKALALIGKKRVIWKGDARLDAGVFKNKSRAKLAETGVPPGAVMPACG